MTFRSCRESAAGHQRSGRLAYVVGTFELPNEHASISSMDMQLLPQQGPKVLDGLVILHNRDHTASGSPPLPEYRSADVPVTSDSSWRRGTESSRNQLDQLERRAKFGE